MEMPETQSAEAVSLCDYSSILCNKNMPMMCRTDLLNLLISTCNQVIAGAKEIVIR